jgi:hypothetical protein
MSEYQYYEFLAIDRPLDATAQVELRAISTRARISSTSFVNSYQWGDLKADPLRLLERYFDAFLYLANWGTRRLALRLPREHFDPATVERFTVGDRISVHASRSHVILDIEQSEEPDGYEWDDGSGWLASLAPLRADLLDGNLRLFHLLWLMDVETGAIEGDVAEPLPNPGPLSAPLAALAEFFGVDPDLLAAAYGDASPPQSEAPSLDRVRAVIAGLADEEKVAYLVRLYEGSDAHLGLELRKRCRAEFVEAPDPAAKSPRTAQQLMQLAEETAAKRRRAEEERAAEQRRRREAEEVKARAQRQRALAERGEAAWREVEELIALRNAPSYDRAAALLSDLKEIAGAKSADAFARRVAELAVRHGQKRQFMVRLTKSGLLDDWDPTLRI